MFSHKIDSECELRLLEVRHAEMVFDLISKDIDRRPELDENYSLEDVKDEIKRDLLLLAENKGMNVGIWLQGRLAGNIRYHEIDLENQSTELGYWLGSEFEGKGLVTKGCRALIDHAFNELGLNRIVITCPVENSKSGAVAERLGFTLEGILRKAEWLQYQFVDLVVYGMLAEEWKNLNRDKRQLF